MRLPVQLDGETGGMSRYDIGFQSPEGALDYLKIEPAGIFRIHGWYHHFEDGVSTVPRLRLNDEEDLLPTHFFRMPREDVEKELSLEPGFYGIIFEYYCPASLYERDRFEFSVHFQETCVLSGKETRVLKEPCYPYLMNDKRVFHRDWIYCSGLPVDYVNPEIMALARTLKGPIFDIGCGTGGFVEAMRNNGLDARGLEIDNLQIRKSIPPTRMPYIQLYGGELPLPFKDDALESVVLSEVLEHLENPEKIMAEIARVCRGQLLVTVPDLSGVPLNYCNGVVPWHLLESTHVNFFSPTSLESFLKKWFPRVELYRLSRNQTNGVDWWGGLMALASKKGVS
ncbi:MAG: methyltransferase domain-containing protein [Verrucomicrobiae bacterium]|nr:methyltransferase domain-containing protein [Verrucomicrobiae bacterium]